MSVYYVNKPAGMTSFDVCFRMRKYLHTKKIGHTGTLDPMATGVMIVLSDKDTKACPFLTSYSKEYFATVLVGKRTDTLDLDGNVLETRDFSMPSKDQIQEACNSFLGDSKQVPPLTSAIKINGKRLYEYQREGKQVDIPARDIHIYHIEVLDVTDKSFSFSCRVSSGTYIRALARDILQRLSLIGTLSSLTRTKVDHIDISMCNTLEQFNNNQQTTYDLSDALKGLYPFVECEDVSFVRNGRKMKIDNTNDRVVITNGGSVLAVYEREYDDIFRCLRGLE